MLLLLVLPLYRLFDYYPEPKELGFAFANDNQSMRKDPVPTSWYQRLSSTPSNR